MSTAHSVRSCPFLLLACGTTLHLIVYIPFDWPVASFGCLVIVAVSDSSGQSKVADLTLYQEENHTEHHYNVPTSYASLANHDYFY